MINNGQIILKNTSNGYIPDASGYVTLYVDGLKLFIRDSNGIIYATSDISESTVAAISAGLDTRLSINEALDIIQTNSINTIFYTYANSTTVAAISAGLDTRINTKLNSSSYTASDVLSKLITVDGTGSGLDADTVDGIHSSSIIQSGDSRLTDARTPIAHASTHASVGSDPITIAQSQVTNLTTDLSNKLNSSSYTASDVLAKLITVDGTGSGLDADTVDGIHSSSIIQSGDSRLTDARTPTAHASTHGTAGSDPITIAQSQVTNLTTDLSNKLNSSSYTASDVLSKLITVDGTGSGLDADTLDGIHSSGFVLTGNEGLLYFTESVNNSTPNTTWPSHIITPDTTAANADIIIQTKGVGALIRDIPDNTATGGNKRGQNSVDLQAARDTADEVASGLNSVLIGGASNSATNTSSAVVGGNNNTATGAFSAVIGSISSQANGTTSGIFCGSSNISEASAGVVAGGTANRIRASVYNAFIGGGFGADISGSATYSGVCGGYGASLEATCTFSGGGRGAKVGGSYSGNIAGYNNTVWGSYSVSVGGFTNYILGNYCVAIGASNASINGLNNVVVTGDTPIAKLDNSTVRGGVPINTIGGYQVEETMMGNSTTTATATALMTPAGIAYIPIGAGECVTVHGVVSAFQNTTTNNAAGYIFECSAKNVGGTVTIIGQTVRAEYANNTAWNMTATVLAGQGVQINAVGAASVTIHWGGSFKIVRVRGA